jgi:predicted glutamine amidotransferase
MSEQWTNYGLLSDVTIPSSEALKVLAPTTGASAEVAPKGWGIGFYQSSSAYVIRKATTSLTNDRLHKMAETISSRAYVAHVRRPTVGEIKDSNTQPYRHGVWLCTHQGTIERFRRIKPIITRTLAPRYREEIRGTTDSEYCLYLFLTYLKGSGYLKRGDVPLENALLALQKLGQSISAWSDEVNAEKPWGGNFIITNGRYMLATRRCAPVFYRQQADIPQVLPLAEQNAKSPDVASLPPGKAILVASHPLDDQPWTEVPENQILLIDTDLSTRTEPFIPMTP